MSAVLKVEEPSAKYLLQLPPPLVRHFDLIAQAPGGVARLRELILTLAVQGKLVPQDPSEVPVDVSVIPAAVAQLIDEGKVPRSRSSSDVEATFTFDNAPNGWVAVTAANVFVPRSGNSKLIKGKLFSEVAENLYPGYSASGQDVWLPHFEYKGTAVILSAVGARCGKAFLAKGKWSAVANTHIIWPLLDLVKPEYSMLLLNNEDYWIRTGGAQPFLKVTETLQRQVFLPPLAEQSRIVTRVEELMQLCDALEASGQLETQQHAQLLNTLLGALTQSETPEALAGNWQRIATHFDMLLDRPEAVDALEQTILQLAVRGLLVPQDPTDEPASVLLKKIRAEKDLLIAQGKIKRDKPLQPITDEEKPFELPQRWELVRFGDLAQISSGVTLGRKTLISRPLLLPYLRVANVQRWFLNLQSMKDVVIDESELARFQVCAGDLLITEGGDWDKVGRTAIWRDELSTCLHQNHVFKVRGVTAEWCPEWAELYLNSEVARGYFAASAKQTTNLASINMTELKHCVFPVPPLGEQGRIVTRVNELRNLCADLRQRLSVGQAEQAQLADVLATQS